MNKLFKLSALSLFALPFLAGCGKTNDTKGLQDAAKQAVAEIGVAYAGYSGSEGISLAGGKLIQEYTHDIYKFSLAYTVAPAGKAYEIEYLKVDEGKLVVEIPTFTELEAQGFEGATYAAYQLSAKVTYKGVVDGQKEKFAKQIDKEVTFDKNPAEWKIRINAEKVKPVWQKIAQARLKEKGETVVTTGYVTAFMNPAQDSEYSNGVWIADGADGMMLYGNSLVAYFGALHIGDMIMVIGPASPYNGLFEVSGPSISFVDTTPEPIAEPVWTKIGESELNSYGAVKANDPVIIENAEITTDVSSITAKDNTAITLNVKVGSKTISYYLNKHTNTAHRQAVIDAIKANAGKKVTIKSVLGWNSEKLQITGCVIVDGGTIANSLTFAA